MDIASGLFALGGVGLAGLIGEIRAWREVRSRRASDLSSLRREVYTKALRQAEIVASKTAQWIDSGNNRDSVRPVWDALTSAYEILNEVRLIAITNDPADSMHAVLSEYRSTLERDEKALPKVNELRKAMVRAFREDLRMPA